MNNRHSWPREYARCPDSASNKPADRLGLFAGRGRSAPAEFYRLLLGLQYRPGDEPPVDGEQDEADWLALVDVNGVRRLALQQVERLEPTTWPTQDVPMQMHLDFTVSGLEELQRQRERAESLGARLLLDQTDDSDEPHYVLADPSGHPFCIFVA